MEPQERDLITTLLTRLQSTVGQPKDAEADALIRQAMTQMPDAPYYLVQTVLIQDLSLHNAQNRIAELEKQLADTQAARPAATSFLGGLLGRNQPAQPGSVPTAGPWTRAPQVAAPPPAAYAQPGYPPSGYAQPGYAPAAGGVMGAMGGGSGGFLRSAAMTAAGVAGGALLFEGISSLFGHGYANSLGMGGMGGMGTGLGETVINNNYGGGSDAGYSGGGGDSGGQDYGGGGDAGGQDYGGGGQDYASDSGGDGGGGGDFGGGGDSSSC